MKRRSTISPVHRGGFTLLEVLLATVILAGALTAVGQLAANGRRAALRTEQQTRAALICQTVLQEVRVNAIPLDGQRLTDRSHDGWLVTVERLDGPSDTLAMLSVSVSPAHSPQESVFVLRQLVPHQEWSP